MGKYKFGVEGSGAACGDCIDCVAYLECGRYGSYFPCLSYVATVFRCSDCNQVFRHMEHCHISNEHAPACKWFIDQVFRKCYIHEHVSEQCSSACCDWRVDVTCRKFELRAGLVAQVRLCSCCGDSISEELREAELTDNLPLCAEHLAEFSHWASLHMSSTREAFSKEWRRNHCKNFTPAEDIKEPVSCYYDGCNLARSCLECEHLKLEPRSDSLFTCGDCDSIRHCIIIECRQIDHQITKDSPACEDFYEFVEFGCSTEREHCIAACFWSVSGNCLQGKYKALLAGAEIDSCINCVGYLSCPEHAILHTCESFNRTILRCSDCGKSTGKMSHCSFINRDVRKQSPACQWLYDAISRTCQVGNKACEKEDLKCRWHQDNQCQKVVLLGKLNSIEESCVNCQHEYEESICAGHSNPIRCYFMLRQDYGVNLKNVILGESKSNSEICLNCRGKLQFRPDESGSFELICEHCGKHWDPADFEPKLKALYLEERKDIQDSQVRSEDCKHFNDKAITCRPTRRNETCGSFEIKIPLYCFDCGKELEHGVHYHSEKPYCLQHLPKDSVFAKELESEATPMLASVGEQSSMFFNCHGECPFERFCPSSPNVAALTFDFPNSIFCSRYGWAFAQSEFGWTVQQCQENDAKVRKHLKEKLDSLEVTYRILNEIADPGPDVIKGLLCSECQAFNSLDAVYCASCGSILDQVPRGSVVSCNDCEKCGKLSNLRKQIADIRDEVTWSENRRRELEFDQSLVRQLKTDDMLREKDLDRTQGLILQLQDANQKLSAKLSKRFEREKNQELRAAEKEKRRREKLVCPHVKDGECDFDGQNCGQLDGLDCLTGDDSWQQCCFNPESKLGRKCVGCIQFQRMPRSTECKFGGGAKRKHPKCYRTVELIASCFYAHSQLDYDSSQEARDWLFLQNRYSRVADPNLDVFKKHGSGSDYKKLLKSCLHIVVREHQGRIGKGVFTNIQDALADKKLVFVLRRSWTGKQCLVRVKGVSIATNGNWIDSYGKVLT